MLIVNMSAVDDPVVRQVVLMQNEFVVSHRQARRLAARQVYADMYGDSIMGRLDPIPPRGLNDENDIPQAWRNMLTGLRVFFPDAVIAGGCLRDRDNGVKVKDVDVFLPSVTYTAKDLEQVRTVLLREGWDIGPIDTNKIYPEGMNHVLGVLDIKYPQCPPVQLILGKWNTDETLLGWFDFGNSQIMWDGRRLYKTQDYEQDFQRKLFRIVTQRTDQQFIQTINRWARLKEKYPAWRLDLGTRRTEFSAGGWISGRAARPGINMQQVPRV